MSICATSQSVATTVEGPARAAADHEPVESPACTEGARVVPRRAPFPPPVGEDDRIGREWRMSSARRRLRRSATPSARYRCSRCRTAEPLQERLRGLLLVGMHLVAQPPRDQRTVQAVLERHADAEIRRQ